MSSQSVDGMYRGVGRRVRALRSRARMTQEELAVSLGVTRSSIANLEAGRQRSPLHMYVGIAREFGVSLAVLVDEVVSQDGSPPTLSEEVSRNLEAGDPDAHEFVLRALAGLHEPEARE